MEHEELVRQVLQALREFVCYCKAKKCQFRVSDVGFLGFVITRDGDNMESNRISTIKDWPITNSVRDVQELVVFPNFYRCFIQTYGKAALRLMDVLKKLVTYRGQKSGGMAN